MQMISFINYQHLQSESAKTQKHFPSIFKKERDFLEIFEIVNLGNQVNEFIGISRQILYKSMSMISYIRLKTLQFSQE
ncbi:MAG: hypothetical protein CM15mP83_8390 [Flavobacteriaceae bacterium]|nr:MAG: hypothetical protein CM15mP83_8390 [Flavobacteriaceae bacterium]